jgi:hypothetical protein
MCIFSELSTIDRLAGGHMTEPQFIAAAERLETIHKQFSTMVLMLLESFNKIETYLRAG